MRAVLDANVIVSALLSPRGTPATVLRRWLDGSYELIVSPLLLGELERALAYPKIRARVTPSEAREVIALLRDGAVVREDPGGVPRVRAADRDDDYLVSLAAAVQAIIVSGDRHLLDLEDAIPVYSPAAFLAVIQRGDR